MSDTFVLDSSAWIEYVRGTLKGKKIRDYIEQSNLLITGVVVAEVSINFMRSSGSSTEAVTVLSSKAKLVPFDFEIGKNSAEIYLGVRKTNEKFSLADAHIVAVAKAHGAKILSCDNDFTGIPGAIVIR